MNRLKRHGQPAVCPRRGGVRWWGVWHGVANNVDCLKGSTLLQPSPPGRGGTRQQRGRQGVNPHSEGG